MSTSSSQHSQSATSAREGARQADGKFGSYSLGEDSDVDLDDLDDLEPDDYEAEGEQPGGDPVGEPFFVPGSSSRWEVRAVEDSPGGEPYYDIYRDGVNVGEVEGDYSREDEDLIVAAAQTKATRMLSQASSPIARITDPELRASCEEYASRYASGPDSLDYEPDFDNSHQVSARDLVVGQRLAPTQNAATGYEPIGDGSLITAVYAGSPGVVHVYCDGKAPGTKASVIFGHGDPVTVHNDRVDLSDPDWYEVEAKRVLADRIWDHKYGGNLTDGEPVAPTEDQVAEMRAQARYGLYRAFSPTDISPLHPDGPRYDKRTANGRAKVGDDVYTSSPMHGDTAYRVLGKAAHVAITGHDGNGVTRAENGEVDYVIENVATGHQERSNLRGVMWRRIPAPGDEGPGAQAQRIDQA